MALYKKESSDFLSELFPAVQQHRQVSNFCKQLLVDALVVRRESGFIGRRKSGVPSIIEPSAKSYELVPQFEDIASPRSSVIAPSTTVSSAMPVMKKSKIKAPPLPDTEMLHLLYEEKKAKISHVRSAFPSKNQRHAYVPPPPPPPDASAIRDFYNERRENLTNVRPAVPSIIIPKDLKKPPPVSGFKDFIENRKQKITNSKPAIPLVNKSDIEVLPPRAPMTHEKVEDFLEQKKLKITNVSPAIPLFKKQHMSLLPPAPDQEMLQIFHDERRAKIKNVKTLDIKVPKHTIAAPKMEAPSYELVKMFYEEKRSRITNIKSATPLVAKETKIDLVPPAAPDLELVRAFYLDKRAKITNIRPAVPLISNKEKAKSNLPAPPDNDLLQIFHEERRSRITNVQTALPKIKQLKHILPPAPTHELLQIFHDERRSRITNVKPSIPTIIHADAKVQVPAPPSVLQIHQFYTDQRARLTNIKSALPLTDPNQFSQPVPPAPSHQQIKELYYERNAKITNIRPALPPISQKVKSKKFLPPPPDLDIIKVLYEEKKAKITHVSPAIPAKFQSAAIPPPPPIQAPTQEMIEEFYESKKERIIGAQSALPQIKPQKFQKKGIPPPPTAEMLQILNDEKKNKLSNVQSATPSTKASLYGAPLPPPPPDLDSIKLLYEEKRSKINNVRTAVPYIKWNNKALELPPPPAHDLIHIMYEEKKGKITNVESALPALSESVAVPPPPPPPSNQMIEILYDEMKSKITKVKKAIPIKFKPRPLFALPPPPNPDMIELLYEQKREKITNLESAVPVVFEAPKGLALPPPPTAQVMKLFKQDNKLQISKVTYAIPSKIKVKGRATALPPPPPPPDQNDLKLFFQQMREKITDVRSCMPPVSESAGPPPPPIPSNFTRSAVPKISHTNTSLVPPPPPPIMSSEQLRSIKLSSAIKQYYHYNGKDLEVKSLTEYPSEDGEYIYTRHPSELSETGTWMKDLESFNLSLEDTHPIIEPPPPPPPAAPPVEERPKLKLDTLNEGVIGYTQDQSDQLKQALSKESFKPDQQQSTSPINPKEESLQELSKGEIDLFKEMELHGGAAGAESINLSNISKQIVSNEVSKNEDVVYVTEHNGSKNNMNESNVRREVEASSESKILQYEEQQSLKNNRTEIELQNAILREELEQAHQQIKNLTDILEGFKAKSEILAKNFIMAKKAYVAKCDEYSKLENNYKDLTEKFDHHLQDQLKYEDAISHQNEEIHRLMLEFQKNGGEKTHFARRIDSIITQQESLPREDGDQVSSNQLEERHKFVEQLQSYTNSDSAPMEQREEGGVPLQLKRQKKPKKKGSPQTTLKKFIDTTPQKLTFYSTKVSPRHQRLMQSKSPERGTSRGHSKEKLKPKPMRFNIPDIPSPTVIQQGRAYFDSVPREMMRAKLEKEEKKKKTIQNTIKKFIKNNVTYSPKAELQRRFMGIQ